MDTSRFIICRAAAGSGKTYTLVRQYLTLAFDAPEGHLGQRVRGILALTFTNKAAGEMKERILRELENIRTQGTACPMGRDIAEATALDDSRLRRYAAIVQSAILHNYSDLAVCTIDSFMHRIVRTFAHDLGLPVNFDVQIDNTALIQNAVDNLMALAGTEGQEELTEVLCDFAESKMSEGKSYLVERELTRLAGELFKEQAPEYLAALRGIDAARFRAIHKEMQTANRDYERQMRAIGQEGMEAIGATGLAPGDFYQGARGVYGWFDKLQHGILAPPNSYALAYLEGDKLGTAKTPAATLDTLAGLKPRLADIHSRYEDLRAQGEVAYNTRTLLLKNLYSLALMGTLDRLVGEYSAENETVHISEFNKRIAEVVRDEPAPFIYERLGSRYRNYLIDEFQDTSRMQWENLVPLVENGIAAGHTSLVVGDGKQAIYRFRQGDVEQFIGLPHVDSPLHGRLLESPGIARADRLEKNFRTARTVVEFNNDFFQWAVQTRFADNARMQQIYIGSGAEADLRQESVKEGGRVQIAFRDLDGEPDALWQAMLDDIRGLVDSGVYHYRDILLLARDRNTLAAVSQYLTAQGVPVVSNESFLLSRSRVVMLLVNLLRYLLDGSDRVSAVRVMQYLQSLGKMEVGVHTPQSPCDSSPNLGEQLAAAGFNFQLSTLNSLGLYDCCEEALRMLGLAGIETAYTATFLGVVARYTQTHRQDLAEFLQWFDEQKDRLSTSTASDLDAVQLMTIHKAKGLEAPVVMYPILNRREPSDPIWVHVPDDKGIPLPAGWVRPGKEEHTLFDEEYTTEQLKSQLDRINILYVALTRPKEQLLVYCQQPADSATTTYNALLRDYVAEHPGFQETAPGTFALGEADAEQVRHTPPVLRTTSPNLGEERAAAGSNSQFSILNSQLPSIVFPSWHHRIAIARQADDLFAPADDSARLHGNRLHDLLSRLSHSGMAAEVIDSYLAAHPCEPDEAETLRQTLTTLLADPAAARFFDPAYATHRETELMADGEVRRPDRIVETPEALWVVDFKTGTPRPEHRDQVERYCQVLSRMDGRPVQGFLLYASPAACQVLKVV
ncbi:MAG: UvrD-helicase domain-containing protein [Bacteroidales bacterium]|nr:UvrD-helicase domain-containing protein [Bacteroidales bacterium]